MNIAAQTPTAFHPNQVFITSVLIFRKAMTGKQMTAFSN